MGQKWVYVKNEENRESDLRRIFFKLKHSELFLNQFKTKFRTIQNNSEH